MGIRFLINFRAINYGKRLMFPDPRPAPRNIASSAASNVTNVQNLLREDARLAGGNTVENMTLDVTLRM